MISSKAMSDKVRTMALATIKREFPKEYAEKRKELLRQGITTSRNASYHAARAVAKAHPEHFEQYKQQARQVLYKRHRYTPQPKGQSDRPRGWQNSKRKQWDGPPNKGKFYNHYTKQWES